MFHDRARLTVVAGRGGDGSIHFRREKFVPRGGPDGGDGGDGGDVVLIADRRRRDLSGFRPNQKVRAERGGGGGGSLSHGARGADAELAVPVGLPNAGKSSLLTRISNARPKVAEYPFTTLSPVLGTVEASDDRQLVVADVPGLIEGASEGIGLGHEFLAHLERARLLVHVIDSAEDDADERWRAIDAELAAYGAGLDERPQIVVLNKIDLRPKPPGFSVQDERILRVLRLSAATGVGLDDLRRALFELVPHEPEEEPAEPVDEVVDFLVYRPRPARRAFRVYRTEQGFRVTGMPPAEDELEAILRAAGARAGDEVELGEETLEWE